MCETFWNVSSGRLTRFRNTFTHCMMCVLWCTSKELVRITLVVVKNHRNNRVEANMTACEKKKKKAALSDSINEETGQVVQVQSSLDRWEILSCERWHGLIWITMTVLTSKWCIYVIETVILLLVHGYRSPPIKLQPIHFFNYTRTRHTACKTFCFSQSFLCYFPSVGKLPINIQETFSHYISVMNHIRVVLLFCFAGTFKWWRSTLGSGSVLIHRHRGLCCSFEKPSKWHSSLIRFKFVSHIQYVSPCLSTTGSDLQNPWVLNTNNHCAYFMGLAKAADKLEPAPCNCLKEAI